MSSSLLPNPISAATMGGGFPGSVGTVLSSAGGGGDNSDSDRELTREEEEEYFRQQRQGIDTHIRTITAGKKELNELNDKQLKGFIQANTEIRGSLALDKYLPTVHEHKDIEKRISRIQEEIKQWERANISKEVFSSRYPPPKGPRPHVRTMAELKTTFDANMPIIFRLEETGGQSPTGGESPRNRVTNSPRIDVKKNGNGRLDDYSQYLETQAWYKDLISRDKLDAYLWDKQMESHMSGLRPLLNLEKEFRCSADRFMRDCRRDYDRLVEQSPEIPTDIIKLFKKNKRT